MQSVTGIRLVGVTEDISKIRFFKDKAVITETVIVDSIDQNEIGNIALTLDVEARAASFKVKETYSEIRWPKELGGEAKVFIDRSQMEFVQAVEALVYYFYGRDLKIETGTPVNFAFTELMIAANQFNKTVTEFDEEELKKQVAEILPEGELDGSEEEKVN